MNDFLIISIFLLFIIYVASIYNRVIRKKNESEKAFGTVEILLKKRYDLLPNLIGIVKQFAIFEAATITEIIRISNHIHQSASENEKVELYNSLDKHINYIFLNSPNHIELKSNQNFLKLQAAWNETEEQISAARRYFNASVTEYNNSVETFPANILMNKNKYPIKEYLEFTEEEKSSLSAGNLFKGN